MAVQLAGAPLDDRRRSTSSRPSSAAPPAAARAPEDSAPARELRRARAADREGGPEDTGASLDA